MTTQPPAWDSDHRWREGWSVQGNPTSSASAIAIRRLEWAAKVFGGAGAPAPESGRLERARRLLLEVEGRDLRLAPPVLLKQLAHANRTSFEFFIIATAAERESSNHTTFTGEKLREMLSGGDDPWDRNNKPRSTQFELFVGALLSLSGFSIRGGEPDLRMQMGAESVGIACKRLQSLKPRKVRRHFKEALEQITGQREPDTRDEYSSIRVVSSRGYIAANLDVYFRDVTELLNDDDLVTMFDERAAPAYQEAARLQDDHALLGVMIFGHTAAWVFPDKPGKPGRLAHRFPIKLVLKADPGVETLLSSSTLRNVRDGIASIAERFQ